MIEGLQTKEVVGVTNPRKLPVVPYNNVTNDTKSNPVDFELIGLKDIDFTKSYHFSYDISVTKPEKNTKVTNLYPCLIDDDTNKPLVFNEKYVYLISNHEHLLHLYFDGYSEETNPVNHLSFYCNNKDFSTIGTANTSSFKFTNIKDIDFKKRYMLSLDSKTNHEMLVDSKNEKVTVNNNPVLLSDKYRKSDNTTFDSIITFSITSETANTKPIELSFEYNALSELNPIDSLKKELEENKRIVNEVKGNINLATVASNNVSVSGNTVINGNVVSK
jgi:hypothetical protein